jgi:hypothetical protein
MGFARSFRAAQLSGRRARSFFLYRFNLNTVGGPKRSASLFVIIWAAGGETMSSFRAAQLSDQVQKVFIFGRFQLYFKMKQQLISR